MKNKITKTTKIELRIDEELKNKFLEYAKTLNKNVSSILREYIEECINKWEN